MEDREGRERDAEEDRDEEEQPPDRVAEHARCRYPTATAALNARRAVVATTLAPMVGAAMDARIDLARGGPAHAAGRQR